MKEYGMLLLAAALLAVDFAINKLYQKNAGTSLKAGFRFNLLLGGLTALVFWGIGGFTFRITTFSAILAAAMALFGMAYTLLGFRILRSGSMALYTLFLMVGGMTVPYIWGLCFLNEAFSPLRTLGLVLLIGAVAVSNGRLKRGRAEWGLLLLCLTVFALNGMVSVLSKLHQISAVWETVSATQFVMLSGVFKAVLAGVAYGIVCVRERKEKPRQTAKVQLRWLFPLVACSAVVGGVSYWLQLEGAVHLEATVLYPFITGGSMVFSTLIGIVAFRERPSRTVLLGVALSFVGTLLFL